jgi:hypothetical protein
LLLAGKVTKINRDSFIFGKKARFDFVLKTIAAWIHTVYAIGTS